MRDHWQQLGIVATILPVDQASAVTLGESMSEELR